MNAFSNSASANLPRTTRGDRIYAIGDIHGRYDLLRDLVEQIEFHAAGLGKAKATHLIILGDMIDRGPDSSEVLRYLRRLTRKTSTTVLLGNHEQMMLRAMDGEPGVLKAWLRFGGDATLRSFGIQPPKHRDFDEMELIRELNRQVPERWVEWLRKLPVSAQSGDYFFCHAGVRPGIPLNRQDKNDLLWIRDEFLSSDEAMGVVVVHGHSISPDVELRHNRIGVDTGAYRTGILTAAYLEDTHCGILSTGNPDSTNDFEEIAALDSKHPRFA